MKLLRNLVLIIPIFVLSSCFDTLELSPEKIELSGNKQQTVIRASMSVDFCDILGGISAKGFYETTPLVYNEETRSMFYEGSWYNVNIPFENNKGWYNIIVSVSENTSGEDRVLRLKADHKGMTDAIVTIIQHSKCK